jgi:hypothetical protein
VCLETGTLQNEAFAHRLCGVGYVARNQCHRRLFAVVLSQLLAALVVCACRSGLCTTTSQYTLSFANLVTGADYYQPIYTSFTFPKFDASLGTLQHVNLAFSFSGRVSGTAVVSGQPPLNGLVNHSIFLISKISATLSPSPNPNCG